MCDAFLITLPFYLHTWGHLHGLGFSCIPVQCYSGARKKKEPNMEPPLVPTFLYLAKNRMHYVRSRSLVGETLFGILSNAVRGIIYAKTQSKVAEGSRGV